MKEKLTYLLRYWFWAVSRLITLVYIRPKFNLVVKNKDVKIPKRPFIIVANHGNFFDPWLVGHLSRYPLSIMMNEEGFKASKFNRWYLKNVGAFPKKKGGTDIKAMRYTLKTLKLGYPVFIFPEGQTTWDGETQPIISGMENIIKRAKLPLVLMNAKGHFLSKPWWSDTVRKGRIRLKRKVISPEELAQMSKEEIRDTIIKYIANNDIKDEQNQKIEFKGPSPVLGLHRFVWICPSCKTEDTLKTDEKAITCTSCHDAWAMDNHFKLKPLNGTKTEIGDLYDWSVSHKQQLKQWINETPNGHLLTQSKGVNYCSVTKYGENISHAMGTLSLTKDKLTFTPDDKNNTHFIELSVDQVNDYVFQGKDTFECRCDKDEYRFQFFDKSPMKWVFYFRYLHNYEDCEKRGYI